MIVSKGSRLASLALLAVFVLLSAAWAEPTGHVMVPMTDGTGLWTDYYLPDNGGPAFPVLVTRSTYGRGNRDGVKKYLERGFACVVQDIRGFGDSKGKKDVFFTDGWREGLTDGADTIAWVKQQPWCDGKVGDLWRVGVGYHTGIAGAAHGGTERSVHRGSHIGFLRLPQLPGRGMAQEPVRGVAQYASTREHDGLVEEPSNARLVLELLRRGGSSAEDYGPRHT